MRLDGKRTLVTGGSRGLGRVIVLDPAARGANIAFGRAEREAEADETARRVREATAALGGAGGDGA